MPGGKQEISSVYSNQIVKPKKKQPSPKMTMNMAGLVPNQKHMMNYGPGDIRNKQLSMQTNSLTGLTNL